jgi:hypothetical protein
MTGILSGPEEVTGISPTVQVLRGWGVLWLAMRKDCGHFDTKLTVTDMLASFVNDIEQYRTALEVKRPR